MLDCMCRVGACFVKVGIYVSSEQTEAIMWKQEAYLPVGYRNTVENTTGNAVLPVISDNTLKKNPVLSKTTSLFINSTWGAFSTIA